MANGNGKAQAAAREMKIIGHAQTSASAEQEDQSFEELKRQISETAMLFGGLVFTPFIMFLGCAYGLRAGIIVALKKTLALLKAWDR